MRAFMLLILMAFGIFAMESGYIYTGYALFFIAVMSFIVLACED